MPNDKVWKLKSPGHDAARLAHEAGLSPLQAQLLINRGIKESRAALSFLTPRLTEINDPMLLKDMDLAVDQIIRAIENREKITIYGDYDADGLTSTALLKNFFSRLDIPVSFYIPSRLEEGYGLNSSAIETIAKRGRGLLITVDCGTANRKEIEQAMQYGTKVVVTDHHQVPGDFQPICPVINPHREESMFPFRNLAGVGVAFFLAIAVRAALRKKGWFKPRPEPDLKQYLDLVALGTVADMVPLLDQNRILVSSGLQIMRNSPWLGMKAIQDVAAIDASRLTPYDLAFKIAPRLNAPGRMGGAENGVYLLTTDNPSLAKELAEYLDRMNNKRQNIEQDLLIQIEETISHMEDLEDRRTLVLSGRDWHKGVLGIVASRLVDRYHRPSLVIHLHEGMATGSGRSIKGFNLHKALARHEHLFEKFGGHDRAVGFTLEEIHVEALARGLEDVAQGLLNEADLIPVIEIDAMLRLSDLTLEAVNQIESLSPFGSGNPEPVFYTHSLHVVDSRVVGERHLKLVLKQESTVQEAIGFGLGDLHPLKGELVHMVYTPEIHEWQGYRKIQLRVLDLDIMDRSSRPVKTHHE